MVSDKKSLSSFFLCLFIVYFIKAMSVVRLSSERNGERRKERKQESKKERKKERKKENQAPRGIIWSAVPLPRFIVFRLKLG